MSGYPSVASRRVIAVVATFLVFAAFFPMAPALAAGYSLSINDMAVVEGDVGTATATFTVTLTPAAGANPVTVTATSSTQLGDTATAGTDYVAGSQLLTFNTGESTKTFDVTINGDTIDEGSAETYSVNLSGASVGGGDTVGISDGLGAGSILDDDPLPIISGNTPSVIETGGSLDFIVSMDRASSSVVTVAYATLNGSAVAPGDYNAASGTLTFNPGVTSQTVTVTINDDAADEVNETFTLVLSLPVNATLGANGTGTILDDDLVAASIDDPSASEAGGFLTYTVTLDEAPAVALSVDYITSDGTANQPGDYTLTSGTLNFGVGVTSLPIPVPVIDDGIDEPNETVVMTLSNPSANASIADATGTGTIIDDEGVPSVSVDSPSAGEGAATVDFTLTLSGPSAYTLTVDWATSNGTATSGLDYTGATGTATFVPGDTSETVSIAILGDNIDEADETLFLTLSNPSANLTLGVTPGTGTITDDDAAPVITVNDISAAEASGTLTFTVSLSNPSSSTVTVDYATSVGTATAGTDYTALGLATLSFAPGETSKPVTVTIIDDSIDEPDETLNLDLTNPVAATIGDALGVGTILDDDAAPTILVDTPSAGESAGTLTYTFTLSNPSTQIVTVNCATSNATATAGLDYTALGLGLCATFPALTTGPQTVVVTILADAIVEGDETFNLDLSGAVNGSIGVTPAVGTIVDDDPTLNIDATASQNENATPLLINVNLNVAVPYTVTVIATSYDGTATAGLDYVAYSQVLTFAPFVTTETISVTLIDDGIDEPNETFTLVLSSPTGPSFIGVGTGTATIIDDEATPTVSINSPSLAEAGGNMPFTLTLSGPSAYTLTLDITTSSGTATNGIDYTATSWISFTFLPGETSKQATVSITDDTTYEGNETFTNTISNLSANLNPGTLVGTGTIIDDDPIPTMSIDSPPAVDEGAGTLTFTVSLSNPSAVTPISAVVNTADGTATAPADYTAVVAGAVNFPALSTSQTVVVTIAEDAWDEADETFTATLSGLVGALPGTLVGTGTISDNDATPQITLSDPVASVNEFGAPTLTFAANLDVTSSFVVTADCATADGSALAGQDYTAIAVGPCLSFPAGTTGPQNIVVNVLDDALWEPGGNQTFDVNLSSPINATIFDGTGTGTIIDNEAAPTMTINSPTQSEGTTPMDFTVSLTGAADTAITVDYTTADGTAVAPEDYTAATSTLSIPALALGGTISVPLIDDLIDEDNQTFTVTLSNALPAGVVIGGGGVGTGTITDNDASPTVDINSPTVDEAAGTMTFTLTLTGQTQRAGTQVTVATADGTALQPGDYTAVAPTVVPFAFPATTATVNVTIIDDSDDELDETLALNLSAPVNLVAGTNGTGTITDNDIPVVSIGDPAAVLEGASAVFFQISLDRCPATDVWVNYDTNDGSAVDTEDYGNSTGAVSFLAAGCVAPPANQVVGVAITDDAIYEPGANEDFTVDLGTVTSGNAVVDGANASGTGQIIDNEAMPTASIDSPTVAEAAGTMTFTITLSGAIDVPVSVDWATGNVSALSGSDYTAANGTASFAAYDTSETVNVAILDDTTWEAAETFTVTLSNPSANVGLGAPNPGTGTITDDDPIPSLSISDVGLFEGDAGLTIFTFTVTASNPSSVPMGVLLTTVDGSAVSFAPPPVGAGDYLAGLAGLLIPPGATTGTFQVSVVGDTIVESTEVFSVVLSVPSNATLSGDFIGYGTIANDDTTYVSINDVTELEGDLGTRNAIFTVTMTNQVDIPMLVDYTVATGGPIPATPGVDYNALIFGTLTFLPGITSMQIIVPIYGDVIDEENETFLMQLAANALNPGLLFSDNEGLGTITDDDPDVTPPVLNLPAAMIVEATGPTGAVVAYTAWATDAPHPDPAITCVPPSGSTFPLGTTTVNCSATDASANTTNGSFTITVVDTTPPTVGTNPNQTLEATGPAGAVATFPTPTATDLVGPLSPAVTCLPASGSTFPLGTTTVTCSATDTAGNTGTSTFTITVQDTTAPVVTVPANMTVEATGPAGAVVSFTATATDLVGPLPLTVTCVPPSGSTFPLGVTTVTCSATDGAGNTGTNTFTITVRDTTPPVLTLPSNMTVEATGPAGAAVSFTATATDLVAPLTPGVTCVPPSGATFALGATKVDCWAVDTAGNLKTGFFYITVVDTTAPVITLLGSSPVTVPLNSTYTDAGATAADLVDGDLTGAIVTVSTVDTSVVGSYTVTYDVTDANGNAAVQVTRTVNVAYFCAGLEATIVGTAAGETLNGTAGDDVIVALDGADTIYGLGGNDMICAGGGNDMIYGGEGGDVIYANAGADYLYGEGGDDALYGGAGNDKFIGGAGNDVFTGGTGTDTADYSGAGAMSVNLGTQSASGDGADTLISFENLIGSGSGDILIGGPVDNKIWGGGGSDIVSGAGGNDTLYGQEGDDSLSGNGGDDILWGGLGNDTLNGGAGTDILDGNSGTNTCTLGEVLNNC